VKRTTLFSHRMGQVFVVGLLALISTACATTTPASSPLTMGSAVSAPHGLLRMCENGAAQCGGGDRAAQDGAAETMSPPTGGSGIAATAPSQNKSNPHPDASLAPVERVVVSLDRLSEASEVNRSINAQIVWRSDQDQYGQDEYWTTPLAFGLRYGDCEDFALEKRRELLARGFPAGALALATARSAATGLHAVLIVRTDGGDYVLDNTTPWVEPWEATPYRWLRVQAGEDLMDWRVVSSPAPSESQLATAGSRPTAG
jgi:predicted transglutaminase-like cysteine proteinase